MDEDRDRRAAELFYSVLRPEHLGWLRNTAGRYAQPGRRSRWYIPMDTRIGPVGLTGTVAGEGSVGYPLASTCLYVRQEECEMPSEECFVMWCDELAFYDATGEWRSKEGRDAFGEHIPHWYHTCVVPRYETDYQQYYPEGDLLASIYLRMLHAPEETRDFLLHEGVWFYDD